MGKIRSNIAAIRDKVGTKIMLMTKANAYGHGLERVALATQDIVEGFGVATVEEGIALRRVGVLKDVLVLICPPREMKTAIEYGLCIGVHCFEQLDELERIAESCADKSQIRVHIKVDTGMHRLGFAPDEIGQAMDRLGQIGVIPEGIYSHMRARVYSQKAEFMRAISTVKTRFPQITAHLAASSNLGLRSYGFDCVRLGIAAYKGAMTVMSEVVEARRVNAGENISYGNFRLKRATNTAIVFGGYADGVKREYPSFVMIRGHKCKTLGRVCMDMFAVDTGDFVARVGEPVTLFCGDIAEDVARMGKTIEYTLMTCWHGRVEVNYVDKGSGEEDCP